MWTDESREDKAGSGQSDRGAPYVNQETNTPGHHQVPPVALRGLTA